MHVLILTRVIYLVIIVPLLEKEQTALNPGTFILNFEDKQAFSYKTTIMHSPPLWSHYHSFVLRELSVNRDSRRLK